jgi:hypothetical protein
MVLAGESNMTIVGIVATIAITAIDHAHSRINILN